jgi:hypothetical protein
MAGFDDQNVSASTGEGDDMDFEVGYGQALADLSFGKSEVQSPARNFGWHRTIHAMLNNCTPRL